MEGETMKYKVWVGGHGLVLETPHKRTANTEAREWRRQGFIVLVRFTKTVKVA